jgi:hypothetical protein
MGEQFNAAYASQPQIENPLLQVLTDQEHFDDGVCLSKMMRMKCTENGLVVFFG